LVLRHGFALRISSFVIPPLPAAPTSPAPAGGYHRAALKTRTLILTALAATVALVATALFLYFRNRPKPWENTGAYAGPLARDVKPFDPSKPPSRPWLDPDGRDHPPATYHTYAASALDGRRTDYLLYLPPGYHDAANAARRYPVVYWLHGFGATPSYGVDGFVEVLDQAIRAGVCPPIIAVLPNGLTDSWYCDAADGSQPVEGVIVRDLIPHVDATYRTIADRRARAVEGFSMGGWGAAHLLFKYPDRFVAATLVGGPIHTPSSFIRWHKPQFEKLFAGDVNAFYAEDPVTRARRLEPAVARTLRVRHLIGAWDGNLGWTRGFHQRLGTWGVRSDLTEAPDVGHADAEVYHKLGPAAFAFYRDLFGARPAGPLQRP
jgi:endo-1,4-beta-xylanase